MNDGHHSPNVEKAVAFFRQAGLSRLLEKLRQKYVELGQVGGQALLENSTANERREIASFLGRTPYADANLRVRLTDIDKVLRESGFDCTLPELLSAFFPGQPLVTRPEQRAARATQQAGFRAALLSIAAELPQGSRGKYWLEQGRHGQEWLFSRYKNAPLEEQERQLALVRYIADALDSLPLSDHAERLALFAQRTSGDPHALDPDRPAGRLLLLALQDLAGDEEHTQEQRLYAGAGLLLDTISSSVAVFNLASANFHGGKSDPLVQAAGERVLLLPLRQIHAWESAVPATSDIYVFENPQVFEEVIAGLGPAKPLPTLVCTAGWPSQAALSLLDLLVDQFPDARLHYSGDFDLKGLQIAAHLLTRYAGRCHPWRFDPASYLIAMQADGVQARANELEMLHALPAVFAPLVATMQETGKWAYQEGIAHVLLADASASCQ